MHEIVWKEGSEEEKYVKDNEEQESREMIWKRRTRRSV